MKDDRPGGDPVELGKQKLEQLLTWVVAVDPVELAEEVRGLGLRYPCEKPERDRLAQLVFTRARYKATFAGALAGLPGTVGSMIPAALLEAGVIYRTQVKAAGRVALIYEPSFFRESDASWELLVPIFGASTVSQFLREAGVAAGQMLTRELIREHLSKQTLATLKRVMLARFGIRVTQKMIITKSVPIVGALIGGTWNYAEVTLVRNRVLAYFAGRELPE
jgi:hypothetical protein